MGGGSKQKTKAPGAFHPNSRKAGQRITRLAHDQRVSLQKQAREVKDAASIRKVIWFQTSLEGHTRPICFHKLHELMETYLVRRNDDIILLELKDDVADRKLSTNALKADELKRLAEAEILTYSTAGIEVPDVTTTKGFSAVRGWGFDIIDLVKVPFKKFSKNQLCNAAVGSSCFDCSATVAVLANME